MEILLLPLLGLSVFFIMMAAGQQVYGGEWVVLIVAAILFVVLNEKSYASPVLVLVTGILGIVAIFFVVGFPLSMLVAALMLLGWIVTLL